MSLILEILKSLLYGIIQGITEWLPISSTGHLILLHTAMPLKVFEDASANTAFWNMYKVVIQLGSILAVVVLYWSKLWPFSKNITETKKKKIYQLWILMIAGSIPVAVIGFLLNDIVDEKLSAPAIVGLALILYGLIFLLVENRPRTPTITSTEKIPIKTAVITGLFESLSLIPGTSRSGSTIIGSLLLGMDRPTATEFSYFLAIPAMLGASALKLAKMKFNIGIAGAVVLLSGMAAAFVISMMIVRSLLYYIRRNDFKLFGAYRIILGVLILILVLMGAIPEGVGV